MAAVGSEDGETRMEQLLAEAWAGAIQGFQEVQPHWLDPTQYDGRRDQCIS
ncbi:hypothetical protein Pcinc_038977, partial [Petrolisthes cinctipes]